MRLIAYDLNDDSMKFEFGNVATVIGVMVILVNIFFHDLFIGLNTPILLIALGLVLFALFKRNHEKKRISRYYVIIGTAFTVYLVALSIIGYSNEINRFFYYGFWLVLGLLLGFRLCAYLYNKKEASVRETTKEQQGK